MPLKPDTREYCPRCHKLTPSRTVRHPSGTEFLCVTCGAQVDFLHDEEAEWQDEFVANDYDDGRYDE